jgi:peptidoglycan/xylan/chitin deacetylase (PgdA/CDA1 family)
MALSTNKLSVARLCQCSGLSSAGLWSQRRFCAGSIRAVNYHDTPALFADNFERQLQFYQKNFRPVTREDLRGLLAGHWPHRQPGLLISFDDGLRDNFAVAAPLLEKYGFRGWFFVPAGLVDAPPAQQQMFAREHCINCLERTNGPADDRLAMSWAELRELAVRGHIVGCHTMNHVRLSRDLPPAELHLEIQAAKLRMEAMLEREIDTFCWVGGEEWAYSREAAESIRAAGYRYSFMTNSQPIFPGTDPFQLQRTNIEAAWPLDVVQFQLAGFLDLIYTAKRRRVNQLTA